MHRCKWGAHCAPSFKLWQVQKVQVSVLALLPGLRSPTEPKGVSCHPTPFSTGCTRCWQHLETGLKIDSLMSQC